MAVFNQAIITNKGKALITKVQADKTNHIEFTKIQTGSGTQPTDLETLEAVTKLITVRQNFPVESLQIQGSDTIIIKSVITNENHVNGYNLKEIGLFANDPTEGEILYSLITAKQWDYMPPYNGKVPVKMTIELYSVVGNFENITVKAGAGIYVLAEEFEELKKEVEKNFKKLDFRTIYYDGSDLPQTLKIHNTASYGADLTERHNDYDLISYDKKIYLIGGNASVPNALVYDTEKSVWEAKAEMTYPRTGNSSILYNKKIYTVGGQASPEARYIEIYDIEKNEWDISPNLGAFFQKPRLIATENKIYIIGSDGAGIVSSWLLIYDIETNTTSTGASMKQQRRLSTATLYNGKIYAIGGENSSGILTNTMEIYDIEENSWSMGAELPFEMANHSATLYNDKIYVIGGWNYDHKHLNSVLIYDIKTNKWSRGSDMVNARYLHTAIPINERIYVINGGTNPGGGSRGNYTTEIYNIETNKWEKIIEFDNKFASGVSACLEGDNIYIIGGDNGEGRENLKVGIIYVGEDAIRLGKVLKDEYISSPDVIILANDNEIIKRNFAGNYHKVSSDYDVCAMKGNKAMIAISAKEVTT